MSCGKIERLETRSVKVLLAANTSDENEQIHPQQYGKFGRLQTRNVKVFLVANPDEIEQILLYNGCPHEDAKARQPKTLTFVIFRCASIS